VLLYLISGNLLALGLKVKVIKLSYQVWPESFVVVFLFPLPFPFPFGAVVFTPAVAIAESS
jgi:hypothetical protein